MKISLKILLPSIVLFSLLIVTAVKAESAFIDAIIAIIEDNVITNNELQQEVNKIQQEMRINNRELPDSPALNRQVLELMINRSIIKQEAERRGVTITETQLNTTMQNLARRNNKTLAEFRETLLAENIGYNDFRNDVKDKMMISSIQNSYAQKNVDITEQEVDDFIARSGADADTFEFRLAHILIALPDGANSQQVTRARNQTLELMEKLKQGLDFSDLANEFSAGGNALQGGDLGWRKLAEVPSLFATPVQQMDINNVSEPIRSASGFHLIKLTDKRDSEQLFVEMINARHILIKPDELTSDKESREKLETIREQVLLGADFTQLAKQYSDDPGSKGLGGDLGWFEAGTMVSAFEEMLKITPLNATSPVFRSSFGYHILQLLGTKTVDETATGKRNKIREQLGKQKKTEVLELWQRRLRDQAFVKILGS